MKRKKEKSELEIYDNIYRNLLEQTKLEIEFLECQIKKQEELFSIHIEREPLRIFHKSYEKWMREKKDLNWELEKMKFELKKAQADLKKYKDML